MKTLYIIIAVFLCGCTSNKIEYLRSYDGDTFYVNIDGYPDIVGKEIGIRINGIDTPEIRGGTPESKRKAIAARDILHIYMSCAKTIELRNMKRGKYFRIVADVYCDGENIAEVMLMEDYAVPYDGGKK
jgi:endonuclease YncB( thermonuclease family)